MGVKVAKEYKWEMGHRLPFHEGPCKNIHGHSYKMRLELSGEEDENGMLLDFYEMDRIINPLIGELDHCFLLDGSDALLINFCKENGFKHKIIEKNTTAENICEFLIKEFVADFRNYANIRSLRLRLWETENAYAEREFVFNR